MKRFYFIGIALICFMFCSLSASASLSLFAQGKTFFINVRNQSYRPIYNARGRVSVIGNYAQIQVEAPGYKSAQKSIRINEDTNNYNETISLSDPTVFADVVDYDGFTIGGGFVSHYSQTMYSADEFGIRGDFPCNGFENMTEADVRVQINGISSFRPRVYLSKTTDRWKFEIILNRREMQEFSNRIRIFFKQDATEGEEKSYEIVTLLEDYENNTAQLSFLQDEENINICYNRLDSIKNQLIRATNSMDKGELNTLINSMDKSHPLYNSIFQIWQFNTIY